LLAVSGLACVAFTSGAIAGIVPPPTENGHVKLAWNTCHEDGGAFNRTFACDTNTGTVTLVLSVTPPVNLPQFNGFVATIMGLPVDGAVPSWWQLQTAGCRPGAMAFSFVPPAGASACVDPWIGMGIGGINYEYPYNYYSPSPVVRLRAVAALSSGTRSLDAGTGYFLIRLTIPLAASTGAGSCADCASAMCFGVSGVLLTQPLGLGDVSVLTPQYSTNSDIVTWQAGAVMRREWLRDTGHPPIKSFQCLSETPVKRPSWGGIKSLYRR